MHYLLVLFWGFCVIVVFKDTGFFRKWRRRPLNLNNWKWRFFKLDHLWMGESNKRAVEACTSLEPGGRRWSQTWPLQQGRQPELVGLAQLSTAAPLALEVLHVWLCRPEGGLQNTKENGKKHARIMTRDKGNCICSGSAHVLPATDVHLPPCSALELAPGRCSRNQLIALFLFILHLLDKGMKGFLPRCVTQTLRLITEPSTAYWREPSISVVPHLITHPDTLLSSWGMPSAWRISCCGTSSPVLV